MREAAATRFSLVRDLFELLDYLIRSRERVVSKDDLINAIWNCLVVSDAALTTPLNAARTAIGDSGEEQRLIKTLPRKGFRFVGPLVEAQGIRRRDNRRQPGRTAEASAHETSPRSGDRLRRTAIARVIASRRRFQAKRRDHPAAIRPE